jgi:hypothetical protein
MSYKEKLELILAEGRPTAPLDTMPKHRCRVQRDTWATNYSCTQISDVNDEAETLPGWFW